MTKDSRPAPHPGSLPASRRWIGFGALMLGLFTILSATTSVSTAIPSIEHDLHANLSQVEWLVDSYLLSLTAFLTTFGRLGDLFGRKRIFLVGAVVFIVGSVACALASDTQYLIAFRALTGLGPAMMLPATLSLITELFPARERGLPMGLWGSNVGVAVGLGPVIGGLLVSTVGWRWVFWSSALLGALALGLCSVLLPSSPRSDSRATLDIPGLILNGAAILSLTFGLIEGNQRGWSSRLIIGCFVLSAVLFVLFVWRESRARYPLVSLTLFRQRAFSAGVATTLTLSFGILALFVFMPLFLQGPLHDSAVQSGLTLLPLAVAMALVGPFGGWLANRVQPRWPISFALGLFVVGMIWLAHLTPTTSWQWLALPFIVIGCGLGMCSANINAAVMRTVPQRESGSAAGVVVTARQLGSVLGVACMGAVLQSREAYHLSQVPPGISRSSQHLRDTVFTQGLNDTFLFCAAVLAIGALFALLMRHGDESKPNAVGRPASGAVTATARSQSAE